MQLWKTRSQHATRYFIQTDHNKTAIGTAIACIEDVYAQESKLLCDDIVDDPIARDWLIETLLQGAYIGEYHIWEKNVKEYCNTQWALNGNPPPFKWKPKKGGSF
jgi:hypothetical protein